MKNPAVKDTSICETVTETWIQSASKTIKPPTKTSASPKSVTKTPSVKDSLDGASPSNKETLNETIHEILETWVQPADENIKAPEAFGEGTPKVTNTKTPIHNFNSMNVKEKVHAYEEIILISPMTTTNKRTNSVSPRNSISVVTPPSQRTPPNAAISQKTPDTVVNTKKLSSGSSIVDDIEDEPDSPSISVNGSLKKRQNMRLSKRLSVSKSLKTLPSMTKIQALHAEVKFIIV
jgi:hypothetical protein